jgi:hypothetical protein
MKGCPRKQPSPLGARLAEDQVCCSGLRAGRLSVDETVALALDQRQAPDPKPGGLSARELEMPIK